MANRRERLSGATKDSIVACCAPCVENPLATLDIASTSVYPPAPSMGWNPCFTTPAAVAMAIIWKKRLQPRARSVSLFRTVWW